MKATRTMQLGILLMLLGLGINTCIAPAAFKIGVAVDLGILPGIASAFILIGFVVGMLGFTQKERE